MMAASHVVVGIAAWAWAAPHLGLPSFDPIALALATTGSLLPDIDHPHSWVGRRVWMISRPLAAMIGHRGLTHSIVAVLVCCLLLRWHSVSRAGPGPFDGRIPLSPRGGSADACGPAPGVAAAAALCDPALQDRLPWRSGDRSGPHGLDRHNNLAPAWPEVTERRAGTHKGTSREHHAASGRRPGVILSGALVYEKPRRRHGGQMSPTGLFMHQSVDPGRTSCEKWQRLRRLRRLRMRCSDCGSVRIF